MTKETKSTNKPAADSYSAASITVLEGLDPVRKRPGMYIGSTSATGLHHLIWEVVDNGIDEAMAGFATKIEVTLLPDGMVEIYDNGRGIPVDKHKATGLSALETVMTKLHAGGKFGGNGYKVSGGLHGVGVSVVNALSEYTKAEVHRENKAWVQEYKRGIPVKPIKVVGPAKGTGTIITFKPDADIFDTLEFDWGRILDRLRQQAYLTKGITISVADKRPEHSPKKFQFYFEGGIKTYITSLHRNNEVKNETIFYVDKEIEDSRVEVALQYNEDYNENVLTFANNIINPEGGTHLAGFRAALTRTLNTYARNKNLLKEKETNLTGDDTKEGLTAIISVKLTNPQFEGQTKGKLGNAEMKTYVEQIFGDAFANFLEENPKQAERIIGKCMLSAQARMAARTARASILRKGALEGMTLPGKLSDCSSRKPEECELYIVEGDSAGGCFSGDTQVALADGRNISFKQLVKEDKQGKQNYCYTINVDGKIAIEKIINPRRTKRNAEVIKVVLDNDEEIICTPDHKFRLADGSYIEACKLKSDMSLAPHHKLSKIKTISKLSQKIDVYDIEVPTTHNFALAAGVFVHNSSKQGRDRKFQAILPLRGKILNVERARLDKMLQNNEIKNLVIAMGMNIGEQLEIDKLRYHKIIIMTDADVDGSHIRTLLLTLFYRHFTDLVTNGHLYIARPPLYQVKKGSQIEYAYSDEEKLEIVERMGGGKAEIIESEQGEEDENTEEPTAAEQEIAVKKATNRINIQRYKGLGEMNPEQLWETTMDPARRMMKIVTVDDAVKAHETFEMLMGSDVAPRKHFIQTHAVKVKNLDI
jgi:DNA gyrase subunit B